jgi:hypothetical protein
MTVKIFDSFEFKSQMAGTNHRPGLVVLFDAGGLPAQIPGVGVVVSIRRPDGSIFEAAVDEAKKHGTAACSYFFAGLHGQDAPRGSQITWADEARLWRRGAATVGAGGAPRTE